MDKTVATIALILSRFSWVFVRKNLICQCPGLIVAWDIGSAVEDLHRCTGE